MTLLDLPMCEKVRVEGLKWVKALALEEYEDDGPLGAILYDEANMDVITLDMESWLAGNRTEPYDPRYFAPEVCERKLKVEDHRSWQR